MTRGQLARRCGVGPETIRFYERRGLMPEAARSGSGHRRFGEDAVRRLSFIRRAKQLGFSLTEIGELLALQDDPGSDRSRVKGITATRLAEVESRLADLERMRAVLARLHERCDGRGSITGCPIIDALAGPPAEESSGETPSSGRPGNA